MRFIRNFSSYCVREKKTIKNTSIRICLHTNLKKLLKKDWSERTIWEEQAGRKKIMSVLMDSLNSKNERSKTWFTDVTYCTVATTKDGFQTHPYFIPYPGPKTDSKPCQSINHSINQASTVMCTAVMDQLSNSELDWMSTVMHGTEYWGRGLIVPCGRDGTVRQWKTKLLQFIHRGEKSIHCSSSYFGNENDGHQTQLKEKDRFFSSRLSFRKTYCLRKCSLFERRKNW